MEDNMKQENSHIVNISFQILL